MAAEYDQIIMEAARRHGVPPETIRRFIQIESGGNPNVTTGSYKGHLQLSDAEFKKHGGVGSIYDPAQNINAGAAKIAAESATFAKRYGRDPTPAELYMIHQQGWGGFQAHMDNPDQPAWQSMAGTGEGRQKGEKWAKLAISGNMPRSWQSEVSPESITSREFIDRWNSKYNGGKISAPPDAAQKDYVSTAMREPAAESAPAPPAPLPAVEDASGAPPVKFLAEAMKALAKSRPATTASFAPLPTSFKQYSSLLKA